MKQLNRYETYSREDIQKIFEPEATFTRGAGKWGILGAIPVPNNPGGYIFIVSFGQSQSGHDFDEGITPSGVLTWQSQPSQDLNDKRVKSWIVHDELVNNIHLFLRPDKRGEYAYLGRLKYLTHDKTREKPVYFQWQILDWDEEEPAFTRLAIPLQGAGATVDSGSATEPVITPTLGVLIEEAPPPPTKRTGVSTPMFRAQKGADYSTKDARDKILGTAGEALVLEIERDWLTKNGRPDLADKVVHTSVVEGDGAGYDIRSFNLDGETRYLEVKTTKGGISTPFFISPNELAFSAARAASYELVRVFEFDGKLKTGKCFRLKGDVNKLLQLSATQFRATVK
jgi:hypothetical protein